MERATTKQEKRTQGKGKVKEETVSLREAEKAARKEERKTKMH